jgi:hypothetical protein
MRKFLSRLSATPVRLLALVSAVDALSSQAAHADNLGTMANTVDGQIGSFGKLLLAGSFLGGVGFCGHGLMKLKAAADSQGREPYGPGLWRIGVGAGLVGLPTFTSVFNGTFTNGTTDSIGVGTATFSN